MHCLLPFLCVCALVETLPLGAKAQVNQDRTCREPFNAALLLEGCGFLPPQLMLRVSYYLYLDTDAEVAISESNLEEPPSSPPPGTEVPDIDTLSRRAIEHYEIHYEIQSEEKKKHERRRRRGLMIAVPIIACAAVVATVFAGVGTSWSRDAN